MTYMFTPQSFISPVHVAYVSIVQCIPLGTYFQPNPLHSTVRKYIAHDGKKKPWVEKNTTTKGTIDEIEEYVFILYFTTVNHLESNLLCCM